MHQYRTHTCNQLNTTHIGQVVRLSGWVHSKRNHGGLLFIDLRDHYGITQVVFPPDAIGFETIESLRVESVVTITGQVAARPMGTTNTKIF